MAYTNFTPTTRVQQGQDGKQFKIWDDSIWTGESGITTLCDIVISFIDDQDVITEYDAYPLIVGADKTKFNEYLGIDGHIVNTSDLKIGGVAVPERFVDGYYVVKTVYSDGTYAVIDRPFYENNQAFLALNKALRRKMAVQNINWPFTDTEYKKSRDIFLQGLYLSGAEDAVDLGKKAEFRRIMEKLNKFLNYYEMEQSW